MLKNLGLIHRSFRYQWVFSREQMEAATGGLKGRRVLSYNVATSEAAHGATCMPFDDPPVVTLRASGHSTDPIFPVRVSSTSFGKVNAGESTSKQCEASTQERKNKKQTPS